MISTVLATAVAAGFLWSVMLFFAAVFIDERRQDAGFGWALAGAVVFFVVFADRLPTEPLWLRDPVTWLLPGVADSSKLFESSLVALVVLFAVYLFRVAAFYELLLLRDDRPSRSERDEDLVNDIVAPVLSYLCFAICLLSLLQPAYSIGPLATVLLAALLVALHFWRLIARLAPYLENLWALLVVTVVRLRIAVSRLVLHAIVKIAAIEKLARGDSEWPVSKWAEDRLHDLDKLERDAREERGDMLADAARGTKEQA